MKLITKEIKKRLENFLSTRRMVKRKMPSVKQSSSFVLVHGLGSYWKQTWRTISPTESLSMEAVKASTATQA